MRTVGCVIIGDELLDGRIADRNTAEIGRMCRRHGAAVIEVRTVPDRGREFGGAVGALVPRCDLILCSGGLGPTLDDATRAGLAEVSGTQLVVDASAAERVRERYERAGRTVQSASLRQAERPSCAAFIENPVGTADGLRLELEDAIIIALPGVPREFDAMLALHVEPLLFGQTPRTFLKRWIFGIGESEIATALERSPVEDDVLLTYCARFPGVEFEVSSTDADAAARTMASAEEALGNAMLPEGYDTPAEWLHALLIERDLELTLAESCTGGEIASNMTDLAGASRYLQRSWVTYADRAKQEELGVPERLLRENGAVSGPVARAMAHGALQRAGANIAIAVSGIAGPGGGSAEKPVGLVHLCISDESSDVLIEACYPGTNRRGFKRRVRTLAQLAAIQQIHGRAEQLADMYGVRRVQLLDADRTGLKDEGSEE